MPMRHQKEDFTLAEITFTFPRSFHKERIHAIRRGDGKLFTAKVCSLPLL